MAGKVVTRTWCLYRWTRSTQVTTSFSFFNTFSQCLRKEIGQPLFLCPAFTPVTLFSQNAAPKQPDEKNKRLKSGTYTRITLIESDGNVTITSLEEAEKVAKRRDMKLVKINDKQAANQRSTYKMMTSTQYFHEELKSRKTRTEKKKTEMKGEKLLSMSDKIDKHDLEAKLKMVNKWLHKKYEVRVVINESEESLSTSVFKFIETSVKEIGKIVQKRQKEKEIKFSILPITPKGTKSEETTISDSRY
ncbi:hypothetical protein R5R35_007136 [Gryllus longicercus]|uniref:Translation initiation factor IF-3 n=1 Tax=Gryllus longicercus TaxID=2509291 RepID=A0AAN9VT98_9ORTH